MSKKFEVYSPETVIFLGAGATARLMPMSWNISEFISVITDSSKKLDEKINSRVFKNFKVEHKKAFKTLLLILGEEGEKAREKEIISKSEEYKKKYGGDKEKIKKNLRKISEIYNWKAFKAIAEHTERDENGIIEVMTLYSQIDILISRKTGFKTEDSFFYPHEIIAAGNCIGLITALLLFSVTSQNIENLEIKRKYDSIFKNLSNFMWKESIKKENLSYESNEFILFSYALISFNWDSTLLGMMFHAHEEANHSSPVPHIGKKVQKLRLFNDFGTTVGSIRIKHKSDTPKIWYQGHESIAIRLNDKDYPNRLMRVGKYIFPHGSFAFRICPVCGKTNFVFRGETKDYMNFYGPLILPEFNDFYEKGLLTEEEKIRFKNGVFDAIQCYKCGNIMRTSDMPLIYQSAVKGEKPPYFEETVNEMLILIKKAKHLVFAGYSLPPDDTVYRSMIRNTLAQRKKNEIKVTYLGYNKNLQNKEYYGSEEIRSILKGNIFSPFEAKKIKDFLNIFYGYEKNIKFSFLGIPDMFDNNPELLENLILNSNT